MNQKPVRSAEEPVRWKLNRLGQTKSSSLNRMGFGGTAGVFEKTYRASGTRTHKVLYQDDNKSSDKSNSIKQEFRVNFLIPIQR